MKHKFYLPLLVFLFTFNFSQQSCATAPSKHEKAAELITQKIKSEIEAYEAAKKAEAGLDVSKHCVAHKFHIILNLIKSCAEKNDKPRIKQVGRNLIEQLGDYFYDLYDEYQGLFAVEDATAGDKEISSTLLHVNPLLTETIRPCHRKLLLWHFQKTMSEKEAAKLYWFKIYPLIYNMST